MDVHYGKPRNVFLTLDPFEMLEYKIWGFWEEKKGNGKKVFLDCNWASYLEEAKQTHFVKSH